MTVKAANTRTSLIPSRAARTPEKTIGSMDDISTGVSIPEWLCHLRESLGFTQDEMAKAIGVSRRTIQNYEKGKTSPGFEIDEIDKLLQRETEKLIESCPALKRVPELGLTESAVKEWRILERERDTVIKKLELLSYQSEHEPESVEGGFDTFFEWFLRMLGVRLFLYRFLKGIKTELNKAIKSKARKDTKHESTRKKQDGNAVAATGQK